MDIEQKQIDKNLYSRQMAVYGEETMGKLVTYVVLIQGLRGTGIETAKNLILAGPAQVILYDNEICTESDRGSNFYIKTEDIQNKNTRARASLEQLQQLNSNVKVTVHEGPIDEKLLSGLHLAIFTDYWNVDQLIEWNLYLRSNNKGFIYHGNMGLYGFAFVDFGDNHHILDKDGEQLKNCMVSLISQEENGLVTVHDSKRHGFSDNDLVTFREVQGMEEVNGKQFTIKVKSAYSFTIDADTTKFSPYTREGIVEQVKAKIKCPSRSLKDSILQPVPPEHADGMYLCDWEKFGYPEQLHLALQGVFQFARTNNYQLPEFSNEEHAQQVYQNTIAINEQNKGMEIEGIIRVEEVNEQLVKNIARYARANISPISSFWGGIVAQEVVKLTGKFTPLRQWLHYEAFEALPEEENVDRTRKGSRYDDLISIFGTQLQNKLSNIKTFLVGAGALGCEFLKLFSLIGLGAGSNGQIQVTDDDNIEVSNLNRQFLFRPNNVGKSKSQCAGDAVKVFNPDINVHSVKNRVAPETESLFNDDFWNSLDFVVNAVDNVKARLFVDSQCVWYGKPLFESGTLGTKCNSQVIIPKLTQSYGDSVDPPEESIPLCTLKNFPNQIEHTIQWARDKFEGYFAESYAQLQAYINNRDVFFKKVREEFEEKRKGGQLGALRTALENVKKLSKIYKQRSYEECVKLGREMFQDFHHNQVAQLLHAFPLDHLTSEGLPFWSGPKRAPKSLDFDIEDKSHLELVQSTANIYAYMFGLDYCHDVQKIKDIVKGIHIEPFQPKKVAIKVDEKDTTVEKAEDDEPICVQLIKELEQFQIQGVSNQLRAVEFEKDDPTNWHIEFVGSVANLRARNYSIKEVDNFQVKLIAGKIIPALATTTAMVVGAVGLEIIKYLLAKPINKMKNCFVNLALPLWLFSEPLPPIQTKDKEMDPILLSKTVAIPQNWTTWDKILVTGPLTVQGLIDHFATQYKVTLSNITYDKYSIYISWQKDHASRLNRDLKDIIESVVGQPIPAYKKYVPLIIGADIDDDVTAEMPLIKYAYRG